MSSRIHYLLNHPFEVQLDDVALLQDEIEKYPYFSTLRTLLLFGLKESQHESFQDALKTTSIYSPSRVALYHYLQKEKQKSPSEDIHHTQPELEKKQKQIEQKILESLVESTSKENMEESQEINKEEKKEIRIEKEISKTNSSLTFSEWLSVSKSQSETGTTSTPSEKEIKFQLIDEFIEKSPKISPVNKALETSTSILKSEINSEYTDLMTETLAQIYTEQRKFDKALKAYKILSLKYPEKSSFFADRIQEIEVLKNSK